MGLFFQNKMFRFLFCVFNHFRFQHKKSARLRRAQNVLLLLLKKLPKISFAALGCLFLGVLRSWNSRNRFRRPRWLVKFQLPWMQPKKGSIQVALKNNGNILKKQNVFRKMSHLPLTHRYFFMIFYLFSFPKKQKSLIYFSHAERHSWSNLRCRAAMILLKWRGSVWLK